MQRFTEVQARLNSLTGLLQIVGALRSLAAARLHEARAVLDGVKAYQSTLDDALRRARTLAGPDATEAEAPRGARTLVVAFLAEHGFVGGYNAKLLEALEPICRPGAVELLIVGSRGAVVAAEAGFQAVRSFAAPSHIDGALPLSREIVDTLDARMATGQIGRLLLCHGAVVHDSGWDPAVTQLLPLTAAADGIPSHPPLIHLPPRDLVTALVEEWLLAAVMRAQVESLACENSARLTAMESAHANVTRKVEQYQHLARTRRQDEITTELLDIVLGAEAAHARA